MICVAEAGGTADPPAPHIKGVCAIWKNITPIPARKRWPWAENWLPGWPQGALITFTGGLGAGKTALCQGIAEGLGCTDPVSSPTFAIVNYYRGPGPFCTL